eukprot:7809002-Alexandrium_andersonii.AAC.1
MEGIFARQEADRCRRPPPPQRGTLVSAQSSPASGKPRVRPRPIGVPAKWEWLWGPDRALPAVAA